MEYQQLYWLAGLLEGEGSFLSGPPSRPFSPSVSICSTDRDVIDRVASIFGTSVAIVSVKRSIEHGWKQPYSTRTRGYNAAVLMRVLRPLMSERRQKQIDHALDCMTTEPLNEKVTQKVADEILIRRNKGETIRSIGNAVGFSHVTVLNICRGTSTGKRNGMVSRLQRFESSPPLHL